MLKRLNINIETISRMSKSYVYYLIHYAVLFYVSTVIANHYLAETFGEYQYFVSLFSFLLSFSQMGTIQGFLVIAPRVPNQMKILAASLIVRGMAFIIVALLTFVVFMYLKIGIMGYLFIFVFFPLTMSLSEVFDYLDITQREVKYDMMFESTTFLSMVLLCVKTGQSIELVVIARFISKFLTEYMKFRYLKNNYNFSLPSFKYIVWFMRRCRAFLVNRIILDVYAKSEILFLGYIATKKELGVYSAATVIFSAMITGESLISRRLVPKLTKAYSDVVYIRKILIDSILIKMLYYVPAVAVALAVSGYAFPFIYRSGEYAKSEIIFLIMLIGVVSQVFSNHTIFLLMNSRKLYFIRFLFGALMNCFLGYLFYIKFSIEGYAASIQLVKLLMVAFSVFLTYYMLNRMIREEA